MWGKKSKFVIGKEENASMREARYTNNLIKTKTIMVNRFILNEVSYFGPGARKE